jgi:hypothetical protein
VIFVALDTLTPEIVTSPPAVAIDTVVAGQILVAFDEVVKFVPVNVTFLYVFPAN